MKRLLKRFGFAVGSLFGLALVVLVVVLMVGRNRFNQKYDIAVPMLDIQMDAATLARGEHLVTAVAHCGYCHGDDLGGSIIVNRPNAQGIIVAPNLTTGAGGIGTAYTDEDWVRAIRHGITPAGRSVVIMPSLLFNVMSKDDLAAVVAYLRNVPPVDNNLPKTRLGPLFYTLIGAGPLTGAMSARVIDHHAPFAPAPAEEASPAYGEYLVKLGQCSGCHGAELAGGQSCRDCPIGPNLTPGGELQEWSYDDFVAVMRTGQHPTDRQLSDIMPWRYFRHMNDTELAAIWAYLQDQPALVSRHP